MLILTRRTRADKKGRSGITPRGLHKRLPASRFRRCIYNRYAAQRLRARTKKETVDARVPDDRPEQSLSIALCCGQMSPVVEVCGCRPHDGRAARTGAACVNLQWKPREGIRQAVRRELSKIECRTQFRLRNAGGGHIGASQRPTRNRYGIFRHGWRPHAHDVQISKLRAIKSALPSYSRL
jgi:hypothetical protein